ncbi:MAG: phosphatidate cytidylyltransferase [Planctomycetales bacterium]|nr:phosphatidate cytidylyltransferase [Planctomycetales bacterium]
MLRFRLLSALILVSTALLFVALDAPRPLAGGPSPNDDRSQPIANQAHPECRGCWIVALGALLFFGSAVECVGMCARGPVGSITAPALIGCAGVMLAAAVPVYWPLSGSPYPNDCPLGKLGWPLAAGVLALLGSVAWYIPRYQAHSGFFLRTIVAGWVSVYFGGCFAFAVALRMTGTSGWGLFLLVGVIVITKFSDAGAYFSGRAFGRTKLCPAVSPGKTVEGLVGGILLAVTVSWIYFRLGAPYLFPAGTVRAYPLGYIALGVLLTLAGVLGDLLESIFKREMGCKDSGKLLPGMGGLWDVSDSLLPAMVLAYLVVVGGLIQGPGS